MIQDNLFSPEVSQPVLEKNDKLLKIFENIHNHIYANDGLSPEQALEETIKILFLKIFDEKNKTYQFKISPNEYSNLTSGKKDETFTSRFRELQEKTFSFFTGLFDHSEKVKLKNSTLGYVVNRIQNIDFLSSAYDVKGLAFQKFIHSSQRVGRGQFFTPDPVIKLCVEIIQPKENEFVLDPACGSGGFLSYALKYVFSKNPNKAKSFAKNNIFGIEINRTVARIAKMRMILDGDGFSNIVQSDALSSWSNLSMEFNKICNSENKNYQEYFDVILTNPPFGTQGKIADKSVLQDFNLGYKWTPSQGSYHKTTEQLNGQVPEILFIERCLDFLKPGGRMAIVLPNGEFENSSLEYLRYYIGQIADVLAVIKLPQETFIPSGTGVKTSILFLRKRISGVVNSHVFFGNIEKIGYSGNKNGTLIHKKDEMGNPILDKNGLPLIDENVTEIIEEYSNFLQGKTIDEDDNKFVVNVRDISQSRLDFEYYKPSYRKLFSDIPENRVFKLGNLVTLKKNKSAKLRQKDLSVRYVELSDVSTQYNEIINSTELLVHELPSRASYELKEGEIITSVAGNSIGTVKHASAYVTGEFEGCICTNGFRVMVPDQSKINIYYLLYYLKSKNFLDQIFRFRTGAAIPSILDRDLLNVLVLLPSLTEQNRIGLLIKEGFKERKSYQDKISTIQVHI